MQRQKSKVLITPKIIYDLQVRLLDELIDLKKTDTTIQLTTAISHMRGTLRWLDKRIKEK